MKKIFDKINDYIMGRDEEEKRETVQAEPAAAGTTASTSRQVVNGAPVITGGSDYEEEAVTDPTPKIRVIKHPNLNILVFEPSSFNDTKAAADSLKASKTILMNYEKIEYSEQIRICDFMNGACYVLDGSVKRISANMVLYVPSGVSIEMIDPISH